MGDDRVELSGFHAVKHALRFGAPGLEVWTDDRARVLALCDRLAPDITTRLEGVLTAVTRDDLAGLTDYRHPTGVLGRAERRHDRPADVAASERPFVHLHRPVDPGNVGAVIRVAAAVGAAGVSTTGFTQLWGPACVRGSAGLHYAVPVLDGAPDLVVPERPVVAFDPAGAPFHPGDVDPSTALVFGSERDGLDTAVLEQVDRVVRLPMQNGVSSLNLATAVAAAAYAMALG